MAESDSDVARFGATFQSFMEAMTAAAERPESPLVEHIVRHMGQEVAQLPVIAEEYESFDQPNVQVALDDCIAQPGREAELVGIGVENRRFQQFGLSDLLSTHQRHGWSLDEGPVDYVNIHLANDQILPCVDFGLYFLRDAGRPLVVLVSGPTDHGPRQNMSLQVLAGQREHAQAFLAEVAERMTRLNVYRGQVISLSPGEFGPGRQTLISFRRLPRVARENVILPPGVLERIERQTIVFSEQAETLRAGGRSLKRGILMYGAPGVGKTLTIEYLTGRMEGRTVILTTGLGIRLLQPAVALARSLVPSMVVLEDVDLIAEDRSMPMSHAGPLLFQLLNEMDGLQEDSDVIFMLTTNRPDILEPALAARPGRIDLAVELPLPDEPGRLRLLELYSRGLTLQEVDLEAVAERIEGATPAYIKEVLRKAAVIAAAAGSGTIVTNDHLEEALAELDEGGALAHRLLGLRASEPSPTEGVPAAYGRGLPSGFPAARVSSVRRDRS